MLKLITAQACAVMVFVIVTMKSVAVECTVLVALKSEEMDGNTFY